MPVLILFLQADILDIKNCPARIRVENCNILPFKHFVHHPKSCHFTLLFGPGIPGIQICSYDRSNSCTIGVINCPASSSEMYYLGFGFRPCSCDCRNFLFPLRLHCPDIRYLHVRGNLLPQPIIHGKHLYQLADIVRLICIFQPRQFPWLYRDSEFIIQVDTPGRPRLVLAVFITQKLVKAVITLSLPQLFIPDDFQVIAEAYKTIFDILVGYIGQPPGIYKGQSCFLNFLHHVSPFTFAILALRAASRESCVTCLFCSAAMTSSSIPPDTIKWWIITLSVCPCLCSLAFAC